jgi:hypothetical protein
MRPFDAFHAHSTATDGKLSSPETPVKSDDRRTMPWEVDNLHLVAVELLIKALL